MPRTHSRSTAYHLIARALPLALLPGLAFPGAGSAQADERDCEALFLELRGGTNPYGPVGDRCEGTYRTQVSSETFLAGVYHSFPEYDLTSDAPLIVEWRSPAVGAVRLAAVSTALRRYYRMDKTLRSGATRYEWPVNVLAALRMQRAELGVSGWFEHEAGGQVHRVYLPLQVGRPGETNGGCAETAMVIVPGERADEMYVSVRGPEPGGPMLREDEPLGRIQYRAQRPLSIRLPELAEEGVYLVSVRMALRSGGSSVHEFRIYHPGHRCGNAPDGQ